MNVDVDTIKQLLELVREHELAEFELEQEGIKIRIRKEGVVHTLSTPAVVLPPAQVAPVVAPAAALPNPVAGTAPAPDPSASADAPESLELAVVMAPIVGTFYRSPDPSSPPFVEIGNVVRKGQTLCIIEAMKLMNEIESEYEGEVVKVYVENGQPVQYGERLFAIKT
jgi:acetyl-CoA carboxylase biotin carboxyl carrier protein